MKETGGSCVEKTTPLTLVTVIAVLEFFLFWTRSCLYELRRRKLKLNCDTLLSATTAVISLGWSRTIPSQILDEPMVLAVVPPDFLLLQLKLIWEAYAFCVHV